MEEEQDVVSEKDEDNEDELNIEANVEENSELLEIMCGENSNDETQKNDDAITTFEANVEEYSALLEIISGENSNGSVNQIWLFSSSFS